MLRFCVIAWSFVFLGSNIVLAQSTNLFALPVVERQKPAKPVITEPLAKTAEIHGDSDFTGGLEITQSNLGVDLKSFGAPHIGSRNIPATIWQGSDAQVLNALIQRLKRSNDPALMQLVRDVLLAETVLPQGVNDQDFLYHRVQGLVRLGWHDDAERLIQIAPKTTARLQEILDTLAIYHYDTARLCPRPTQFTAGIQAQKLEILCLLIDKKFVEAELQAKLLQEITPEIRHDGFETLVHAIVLQEAAPLPEPERIIAPEPVHLVLTRLGGITPHFPEDSVLSPRIQAMLMDMPTLGIDQRLAYAEAAYAANAIGIDDLQRLQFARIFREAERENAATLLQQFPAPNARALLTQVLSENPDRSDLVIAGLHHGDQHGLYAQMFDSVMAYLPMQPSLALARAHLALQNFTKAQDSLPETMDKTENRPLREVLEAQMPTENIVLDEQGAFLQSLIIDEDIESATNHDSWHIWRDTHSAPSQHKDIILALLPSLGVPVPELREPEAAPSHPEQYGEALLNSVLHLGLPNAELDPNQVHNALYILDYIGFGDVAKAYAARRLAILLAPV